MEYIEEIPTYQAFRNDILPIFSDGDLEQAHNALVIALGEDKIAKNTGKPLTWAYILEQFTAHIRQWDYYFKKSEASGYLSGKDRAKRLEIQTFIEKEAWNKDYVLHKSGHERDNYLFGKLPINNIKAQLEKFREAYNKV